MTKTALAAIAVSICLAACDDASKVVSAPQPTPVATPAPDPVKELKLHFEKPNPYSDLVWTELEYDVKKTDSLVSPVVAKMSVRCGKPDKVDSEGKPTFFVVYEADLAFRDGAWQVVRLQGANGWGFVTIPNKDEATTHWAEMFERRFQF